MSHYKKALEEGEREFDKIAAELNANYGVDEYRSYLTQFAEKIRQAVAEDDVEWVRKNAQPQLAGWEDTQRTIKLAEFITHKREQLTKE